MTKKSKSARRRAARFEKMNLSNISENSLEDPKDSFIDDSSENTSTNQSSLDASKKNKPIVTNDQVINPPLKLNPIPQDRQSQTIQTNAEDSLPPGQIPSILDMSLLTSSLNKNNLSQPAKEALAITDCIHGLSQRVDQMDGNLAHVSQALIALTNHAVTTDYIKAAIDKIYQKIKACEENSRDRITMIDNRVVQMETQHNQLLDRVQVFDSQATAVEELELQVHELRDEVVNGNEANSAMQNEIGKIASATTELGRMLTGAQIAIRTTLNHTSRIAKAVASVPEIREKLWTEEEVKNWSALNPNFISPRSASDNLKNMSANEERLFQIIREIPRRSLGVPVSGATRTESTPAPAQLPELGGSPVHHSSRVEQPNNSTEGQIAELWQELAKLGARDQSQALPRGAGDNTRSNTSGNQSRDQGSLVALEKLARSRNLGFPEQETQPKIYLQELQEFKEEQQMTDRDAISLVKALFARTQAQWLRLSSNRWTTWEDFVNAFTVYFIHPRADPEISAEIYNKYQAADQEARIFIDDMQKLFMEMASPPSEEVQVNIISQRLTKQLQVELRASPTKFTEYIGFRLAVNIATTNLQYLRKAYDENEKLFVKKKSHSQSSAQVRVIQSPEIIPLEDEEVFDVTEIDSSINYVKNNYPQRRGNFTRTHGPEYKQNKNSGRHVSYAADVKDSDISRSPLASRESSPNRGPAGDYVCFNCGMAGDHYTRYCTNERQEMCTRCKTLGLSNATCPCDSKNA